MAGGVLSSDPVTVLACFPVLDAVANAYHSVDVAKNYSLGIDAYTLDEIE